ncbi:hypothetical protein F3Y22_tig00110794pilonHSYRG00035 [Hibiscus syriacus]|uniref:Uncharacterized protein n=1 Tax=Hibiscus syriacus TaxID=106335 RepID=A0A6A2ZPJ8_HIBSY|nr:leucine-rich repeat extensin-like protein 5 [Hibiscus syriacus]KAE8693660.1 hypothetical protein F3Y22_tig00110794pilonHSYRG00035 [Hibiscus syriacus]
MSNQQAPTRPWFRLASISRPTPQAPTPTPEPAPAMPRSTTIRPAFRPTGGASSVPTSPVSVGRGSQPSSPAKSPTTEVSSTTASVPNSAVKAAPTAARSPVSPPKPAKTSSLPSSPAKPMATTASVPSSPAKQVATTTFSVPTSPAKTAPTTTSVTNFTTTTNRVASPQASTVKPAMQSPIQSSKIKPPTAPPPSPLTLPPPQVRAQADLEPKIPVEAEKKTVLVQEMIDKPKGLFGAPQKDTDDTRYPSIHGQREPSKHGEMKEKGNGKKLSSDSEDSGMRVITIAGENKGAFMELIKSPHRNGFQGSPHRLQKPVTGSSDGSVYHSYSSSGEEGDLKMEGKSNGSNTAPMNAFMNSNVQGVNNSIVYNSSCTHHDPGVNLSLHIKPNAGGLHFKERTNGYNS